MPKTNIVRSKFIDAPVEKVYKVVSDMSQWSAWSPWLISDPDAKVTVRKDNNFYSWIGKRVGSGEMGISSKKEGLSVDYDLLFIKPWKSKAKVKIETIEKENGTDVRWHMDSSLPIFMFWMKKTMEAWIGMDYDRGLKMLKDYVEKTSIPTKLTWKGEENYAGCNYIGIKTTCDMKDMPTQMKSDFEKIMSFAMQNDACRPHECFSQYHKWELVKQRVTYTAGVPYNNLPGDLPSGFISGNIPATKIYTLQHTGSYDHVGNAWSTMQSMIRNREFKMNKKIHPFETYGNSPKDTAPEDLILNVHFAIK